MSKISINYNGSLQTNLTHEKSLSEIQTDAPVDNNGLGLSFSPTDLVAGALASCIMTILAIKDKRSKWGILKMNADVEKIMQSNPRRIKQVKVHLRIKANELNTSQKKDIRIAAETCPVALSLHPETIQELTIEYI